MSKAPRVDFGPPPPGYVAGLGRGAVGFTTRSDIGPARPAAGLPVAPPPGFPGAAAAAAAAPAPKEDFSESNFDQFSGYQENLWSGVSYDKEDDEADRVYQSIDNRMDSRRKKRREIALAERLKEYRSRRPRIQEQFADLKRDLGKVSGDEWETIPESMDFSRRNKMINQQHEYKVFTPVPEEYLGANRMDTRNVVALDSRQMRAGGMATPLGGYQTPLSMKGGYATPLGRSGMQTPLGYSTPLGFQTPLGGSDLTQLGRARDKVLSLKLDRMADSVSGQTVVDPKGYLTDLNSLTLRSDADVSDIKKARLLLKSVTTTNPKHAPGWIAAARLEKETGKLTTARAIIMKGCEINPKNEDVWLEAAQLHPPKQAKVILSKAVQQIPTSVKLWMRAAAMEQDTDKRKSVLRRGLELIPNSITLWKAAVELENPDDARIMLNRAVELVPTSVEMWLALAKLESYERAKIVLNRARQAVPTEPAIWITAAKLEEAHGNADNVDLIIRKAVKSLEAHQVIIDRDAWLAEAEKAEKAGSVLTCQAIVRATIGMGIDDQDRKNTWFNDADHFLNKGSIETARAIFAHMLTVFPGKRSVWLRAAQLERQHGTKESLDLLLKKAVQYCPQAEVLWLMAAKEKWLADDVPGARAILNSAFAANPDSEEIWLAAVKLESENKEYERARILLTKARDRASTARVWMKSAKLERKLGNTKAERELIDTAIKKFPGYSKLWIMLAQHLYAQGQVNEAREVYKEGLKQCPKDIALWLCNAKLECLEGAFSKARSLMETARLRNPKNAKLWLGSIKVERLAKNFKVAQQHLAKALQECPDSGILWAHAIATDPRPVRKSRSYDALKRAGNDAQVFLAVAKLFWLDRKIRKARNWFNRAVTADPDLGDTWVFWYKFELEQGGKEKADKVLKKCAETDPRHGELWISVSKDDANSGLKPEEILKKCVETMSSDLFAENEYP